MDNSGGKLVHLFYVRFIKNLTNILYERLKKLNARIVVSDEIHNHIWVDLKDGRWDAQISS